MNLEELRSVQDAERRKSALQPLRESFYEEAGEYIATRKEARERAADRAQDPFASTEVRQLADEIATAEEVLQAIYERRMGKLLERASLTAAGMTVDEEGLTAEEQELFEDLVERISENKELVLGTLVGDPPHTDQSGSVTADSPLPSDTSRTDDHTPAPATDHPTPTDHAPDHSEADAAAATSDADPDSENADSTRHEVTPTGPPPLGRDDASDAGGESSQRPDDANGDTQPLSPADAPDRVTVRITADVGAIYGVDDREYVLAADDVVTLPAANADPLLERGAAEELDRS